jgi:predicted DNA-binding transcriptional regulator YafY
MKTDRMLTITVMLLNRDCISAKELAEKFEISVRTVYRDIDAINMAGIPIISYPGNNGGFGIMENYSCHTTMAHFQ